MKTLFLKYRKAIYVLLSAGCWLLLWQLVAMRLDKPLILPYPKEVWSTLAELVRSEEFFSIVGGSLLGIAKGFAIALLVGIVLAIVCSFSELLRILLAPAIKLIKTVPVASFIILLLFWVGSNKISVVISFLIVLPVVYENVARGIRETDGRLLEMGRVFRIGLLRRLRYMYLPSAVPYSTAACSVGLSLCWKAGIAAEIIANVQHSIGRQLYDAKLFIDTKAVFAWTVIILVVSVLFEWVVMIFFRALHVWLADSTLRYHPLRMWYFVLGIPAKRRGEELPAENEPEYVPSEEPIPVSKQSNGNKSEPLLTLTDVSKSYDGRSILGGISLALHRGDVVLVTGPSGCGKTTLLRVLLGLTKPDGGERIAAPEMRMSAVFQEDRLCEAFSAWQNIALTGSEKDREGICAALRNLGIEEPVKKPVREFSGGMRRRVAWVRALSTQSDVLVLDEPFSGLDAARIRGMLAELKACDGTRAIVLVTHGDAELARLREHFPQAKEFRFGERVAR